MHFEQHTELDNLIAMQNLRTSANKGSNDAFDVHTSLTGTTGSDGRLSWPVAGIIRRPLGSSARRFRYFL